VDLRAAVTHLGCLADELGLQLRGLRLEVLLAHAAGCQRLQVVLVAADEAEDVAPVLDRGLTVAGEGLARLTLRLREALLLLRLVSGQVRQLSAELRGTQFVAV